MPNGIDGSRPMLEAEDARGVGADAKQRRMAQRHLAGVAEHDVEPEQQDGVDADHHQQMQVIGVGDEERQRRERGDQQSGFEDGAHRVRPS